MSTPTKTPSPKGAPPVPGNTPMAPPTTPGAHSPSMTPATPGRTVSSPAPHTPGTSNSPASVPRTPGGSLLKSCSADPTDFTKIKIHTAKCTECDQRNETDNMLRCPGCGWQICVPCQEKRTKKGRDLIHGGMGTPGGLLGLRSGGISKRRVLGSIKSPAPSPSKPLPKPQLQDDIAMNDRTASTSMASTIPDIKGKGRARPTPASKPLPKKRPAKGKAKVDLSDESSDDDFAPDPTSPTTHKRRRTTLHITDTPTATSARPHRRTAHTTNNTQANYVTLSSPSPDASSDSLSVPADIAASTGRRPTSLNHGELQRAFGVDVSVLPEGRIHELLRENGIDVPGRRYNEHFLARREPVVVNPVIGIPDVVRRMAETKGRLSAEERVEMRNREAIERAYQPVQTLRLLAKNISIKHTAQASKSFNPPLTTDESAEISSALDETARKWASATHAKLPAALQRTVDRGLDMRLDHVDAAYRAQVEKVLEERAAGKIAEYEEERRMIGGGEWDEGEDTGAVEDVAQLVEKE
ncbi:hypothetical protein BKA63DRAFT_519559 [Paraphoma chrysanthemicola]|nr:hypothetical protein BKA63DRAFT_519559 [Paraphoma chrysanthemicola]